MTSLRWAIVCLLIPIAARAAVPESPLKFIQSITLKVEGRIDHMSLDIKGRRLFVAALGNNTVEVVDLDKGQTVGSLPGFQEPQGVLFLNDSGVLAVANGGDGRLQLFDGTTLKPLKTLSFAEDADNVRYDEAAHQLYVGYGQGALGIVDPDSGTRAGDIDLEGGHPESFQLERNGSRIFINVPPAREIVVADRQKHAVISHWKLDAGANYPMALDEGHGRLFVAFRNPPRLEVFDVGSGLKKAEEPLCGDSDDIFYDTSRSRIYAACGEGFVEVFSQKDSDHYRLLSKIPTARGARTAFFDPESSRLYIAVPHRGKQKAEIRAFAVQ